MKSYLSLIPISAKVRKRQNRMTILCIVISVLLVTVIFGTVDMLIRGETVAMQEKHGSWHIKVSDISEKEGDEIRNRSDVTAVGWSADFNADADQPYTVDERKAALYGTDETYLKNLAGGIEEGAFPQNDREAVLSSNARFALDVNLGDSVTLQTPAGSREFTISGFGSDDREYYEGQTYLIAVYMTKNAFISLMKENGVSDYAPSCYVQFQSAKEASDAIGQIREQYNLQEDGIQENTAIMGLAGQSSSEAMKNFYGLAAVLFVMVLAAGVLMISGSMNSQVTWRIKFFGMMRCIGASRSQVMRFVKLEALNWCKTAIPVGLVFGTAVTWIVCALVRCGIGGEFAHTPVFSLSPIGLTSGAVVGLVTVLLAAQAPAKRASKISPMAAVSGGSGALKTKYGTTRLLFGKVEWTLGVHHATSFRKNWFLMTASFALSIILFLCFSVGLEFAHALVPSLRSWQPDITLNGYANDLLLEPDLLNEIREIPHVEKAYGAAYLENIPADSAREGVDHVSLMSYTEDLLDSMEDSVVDGDLSAVYGNSGQVMTIHSKDNPLQVGDRIKIGGREVTVACAVSDGIYPSEYSVICSGETFQWLTGETNFSLIGIQLDAGADDETIRQINRLVDSDVIFDDLRRGNQEDAATYLAAQLVLYSVLAIIAMITLFNMINSISMSVTARIRQYGAMRAVGMDGGQAARMVIAESLTYAISGLIAGVAVGLPLSRSLYIMLLTRYFGIGWSAPAPLLFVIVVFVIAAAFLAAYVPSKRIRNMAITETINELC